MPTDPETKYRAPALEKGLDIIELLSDSHDEMSQSEIARALDRSQSEIYRMLSTLVRRGYVSRTSGDRYSLSLKLFSTAQRYSPINRLLEVATPKMRRASRKVWQSCHLGMEAGGSIVIVSSVESPGNWGLAIRTGSVIGLCNTGTGRVLAAFRSEEELQQLITTHTPAVGEPEFDEPVFRAELQKIRELGYYKAKSETTLGVTNLSFPIFHPSGEIVAVLSCPFLERVDAMRTANLEETEQAYRQLADDLTAYFRGGSLDDEDIAHDRR
ncbi:IclR family transcriptional regulator [Ruegeria sp. ANG-R]|uniref:IclR family transcriptional regulator n=1 Tax=Ruegeria sp. ANG-R TaxID=1577903 RepID=UPI00057EA0C7|nr:IclR family transcriptional regulator [Ruegeria sp. ANG-R]KIC37070.1 IclR family transcriptional regulator [Ruegeria sp. ANG-R]